MITSGILLGIALLCLSVLIFFRNPWFLAITSLVVISFVLEAGSLLLEQIIDPNPYNYQVSENYRVSDPLLRNWFKPNAKVTESKYFDDGVVVYDEVTYNIDPMGRRQSKPFDSTANHHALFFGGSFTFGMGVQDDQTIASVFAIKSQREYQAFNYGGGGFGTSAMLIQLQRDDWFSDVRQSKGIAIYCFVPRHLARSTGHDLYTFNRGFKNNPIFYRDSNTGEIKGPVKYQECPRLHAAVIRYEWLTSYSAFLRAFFKRVHPNFISEKTATMIISDIIIQSAKLYKNRFQGEFFVLIWPRVDAEMNKSNLILLKELLNSAGIKVVSPSSLKAKEEGMIHPRDAHPSASEYNHVAVELYDSLSTEWSSNN
jgi:hypothetical protein